MTNETKASILNNSIAIAQEYLAKFAKSDTFLGDLTTAFGSTFDTATAAQFQQEWLAGDFDAFSSIEILSSTELNGAYGAYAQATNTIYLSAEFISANADNLDAIATVLLEEMGHAIDAQLNALDSAGDEGAIFSALVQGDTLTAAELSQLRAENDTATLTLGGQQVVVERSSPFGNALDLDGIDDQVDLPTLGFTGNTSVSASAWIKVDSGAGPNNNIFGFGPAGSGSQVFSIRTLSNNSFRFYFWGNDLDVTVAPYFGQWTHVAATYDAATQTQSIYVNGNLAGTRVASPPNFQDQSYRISGFNNEFFDGSLDEVRVWNVARTQAEIANSMGAPLVGNEAGLVAYYNFDSDSNASTTITDGTSGGNNGTLINGNSSNIVASTVPPFPVNIVTITADGARDVATADVDGDGDLDVLSASTFDHTVAWYENDGSQNFTKRVIATGVQNAFSVTSADVDGDGDLDVLSASQVDNIIAWYENDGSENFTKRVITNTAVNALSVDTADVDGDGDLDVLSASFSDNTIAWYENDGSENFTKHVISNTASGASSVTTADVDGDGDLDVLSASYFDSTIAWYENDGSENFTKRIVSNTAGGAQAVTTADVDGDGDLDVIAASESDDTVAWYENDGSQGFTERILTTTADSARDVSAVDVDGDGDVDILAASANDNTIAWFENNGSQSFTERILTTNALQAFSVTTGDVDNDGDLDVLSASVNDDKIAWYENGLPPSNQAPTATNLSAAESYTEDTALDLIDIVVSDVDSANVTATLTLSNPATGSLSTATSNAVTSTYNQGAGVWKASGAIADVNTLLAGVIFNPAADFNGDFDVTTSVDDGVNPAVTGNKNFTGIADNDAPVVTPGQSFNLDENTANITNSPNNSSVGTLMATDVDGPAFQDWTIVSGSTDVDGDMINAFEIDDMTGEITVQDADDLDFEQSPIFSLGVTVTDGTDTSAVEIVTVNLADFTEGSSRSERVRGGSAIDQIDGLDGNDRIYGYAGTDTLFGGNGRDYLYGGDDNDFLDGGDGNDVLDGQNDDDMVFGREGNDIVRGGNGNDYLEGNNGNDKLYGFAANDTLIGGDDVDTLYGGNGDDFLDGGLGDDFLYADQGIDTLLLQAGDGNDSIYTFDISNDALALGSGLTAGDLSYTLSGLNTEISITATSEVLATLINTQTDGVGITTILT